MPAASARPSTPASPKQRRVRLLEIRLPRAEGLAVRQRHVQAAVRPVAREILPEIRQLQRRAERVRRAIERFVSMAGDPQHQPADRIRRPRAVVQHVVPRCVALDGDVLPEGAEQIVEQRHRQVVRCESRRRRRRRSGRPDRRPTAVRAGGGSASTAHASRRAAAAAPNRCSRARRRSRRPAARTRRPPTPRGASAWAPAPTPPESSRSDRARAARRRRRRGRQRPGTPRAGRAHHSTSGTPARWLTARAMVNSRSDRRLT